VSFPSDIPVQKDPALVALSNYQPNIAVVIPTHVALGVLQYLYPPKAHANPSLSADTKQRLVALYRSSNELLRHFLASLREQNLDKANKLRVHMNGKIEELEKFRLEFPSQKSVVWGAAEGLILQLRSAINM